MWDESVIKQLLLPRRKITTTMQCDGNMSTIEINHLNPCFMRIYLHWLDRLLNLFPWIYSPGGCNKKRLLNDSKERVLCTSSVFLTFNNTPWSHRCRWHRNTFTKQYMILTTQDKFHSNLRMFNDICSWTQSRRKMSRVIVNLPPKDCIQ